MDKTLSFYEDISKSIAENENYKQAYKTLIKDAIICSLGLGSQTGLELDKITKLIETAAILSLSNDDDKTTALKIINSLLLCDIEKIEPNFLIVIKIILTRMGNFPGASQIGENPIFNGKELRNFDVTLRNEIIDKYELNSYSDDVMFTDFQAELFQTLKDRQSVSFSAPTSAGKSFAIIKYISNIIKQANRVNICLIVPTKALITQMLFDLHDEFKVSSVDNVHFFTTTAQLENKSNEGFSHKNIFILTQERLQYLLNFNKNIEIEMDILIVDEAQKIGDGSRGVILETAILEVINRNPDVQVITSTPLAKNPSELNRILGKQNSSSIKTMFSPVPQFLFNVCIEDKTCVLDLINLENEQIKIKTDIEIEKKSMGVYERIAFISTKFGENQMNIVFSNGPAFAEQTANLICGYLKPVDDPAIKSFISFLKEEVHPLYNLIGFLKYGVAFHYSDMPHNIKYQVEELYKDKCINYLCCTSTLLEGVNLPARNIFIYNPKQGWSEKMTPQNFWNLIGRAGRLKKELVGNIFCINMDSWNNDELLKTKNYQLYSATEKFLREYADEFIVYLSDLNFQGMHSPELYEQTASSFIKRRMLNSGDTVGNFVKERNLSEISIEAVKEIDELLLGISKDILLPIEVIQKNPSIDPRKQDKLFRFMMFESSKKVESLLPIHPNSSRKEYYNRLKTIFQICDSVLGGINNNAHRHYAVLARKWLSEQMMGEIISGEIAFINRDSVTDLREDPIFVNKIIRETFESINDKVIFHYARYTQCYVDVLKYVIEILKVEKTIDFSLPLYLEYGVHRETSVYSVSKGCSRSLAIRLTNLFESQYQDKGFKEWILMNKSWIVQKLPTQLHEEFIKLIDLISIELSTDLS